MSPLRQKMIRELELHRKSPKTVEAYVTAVAQLAQHYRRPPDRISLEEVRDFLHHLITQRKLAYSWCNQKLAGIRFFYRQVLGQGDFQLRVPAKRSGRLPEPLSRGEIARLLEATRSPKHRILLMTAYAAGRAKGARTATHFCHRVCLRSCARTGVWSGPGLGSSPIHAPVTRCRPTP